MIVIISPCAALEFTSLPMLGWLVAAALPWLIHRLVRQHHRTTSWAAVELLLGAMQQRARRVQLEQWLLLAVRTAILVLVALAVAAPTWRQWGVVALRAEQTHRIIVLDQSYSMGGQQQAASRWQRGRAIAREWIESREDDALTLIGWSHEAENLIGRPTFEPSVALSALEDLELTQASGDLATAARAVLAAIDRAEAEIPQIEAHHVVFCTDLSRGTWAGVESAKRLLEAVAERARVTIVNVAARELDNVAVASLSIEPTITLQQHEATLTVSLNCFGTPPPNGVRAALLIEGRQVDSQQTKLQTDGETVLRFQHRFIAEGAQTVQVVLTDNHDGLISDDARWLSVNVRPRLRVACFADQRAAMDDLARALAPLVELAESDGAIEPELFSVSRLGQLELSNYAAVLLSGGAKLLPREAAALTDYVRQGGGLAIFLGQDTIDDRLDGLRTLLPLQMDQMQPVGEYRLDPQEYRHPIVAPFRGQNQAGLLGVVIRQYWRLNLRDERPAAETVLKFDTGDPALVVDRFGLGRVAVSALPLSLQSRTASGTLWSSFALSPSFLPVVRELVAYLVGDTSLEQRNLVVGQPAVFSWRVEPKQANVRLPTGERRQLLLPSADDLGQIVFRETNAQGEYRFSADDQERARFAINLDGRDSDLSPIDLSLLPVGFSTNRVIRSVDSPTTNGGFQLARTLLACALVLLLLEIGLAWLLGRGWG